LLCISYGAGKQFVGMLQSMGLSLHWDTMWVIYNWTCSHLKFKFSQNWGIFCIFMRG
jgi:hypothetical protein